MANYTINIANLKRIGFDFGLKDYPIFKEEYRDELNDHILNRYLIREIGFETPHLFKVMLNQKMWEIMPKYNAMFEARVELIRKGLIYSHYQKEVVESSNSKNTESESNGTASSLSKGKEVFEDTPHGVIAEQTIDNVGYASNINLAKQEGNSSTNANATSSESGNSEVIREIFGYSNLPSQIINEINSSFINIEEMIIKDLDELFMQIY